MLIVWLCVELICFIYIVLGLGGLTVKLCFCWHILQFITQSRRCPPKYMIPCMALQVKWNPTWCAFNTENISQNSDVPSVPRFWLKINILKPQISLQFKASNTKQNFSRHMFFPCVMGITVTLACFTDIEPTNMLIVQTVSVKIEFAGSRSYL